MRRLTFILSFIVLAGAGCAPTPPSAPPAAPPAEEQPAPTPSASFVGSWKLAGYTAPGKAAQDVSGVGAKLTLGAEGRLSAVICNSMSGDYAVEDGRLKAPEVASTLKFCTGLPGEIEAAFAQGLAAGMTVEVAGAQLTLGAQSGARFVYVQAAQEPVAAGDRATSGEIVSIDMEKVAVDGPAILVIKTAASAREEIHVPSFGIRLCAAHENIADVYGMKVGQRVEVNGAVSEDGAIVPCSSTAHYLRIAK